MPIFEGRGGAHEGERKARSARITEKERKRTLKGEAIKGRRKRGEGRKSERDTSTFSFRLLLLEAVAV